MYELMRLVSLVMQLLVWAIIGRAILSWFQPDPYSPIMKFLASITDPILRPVQRVIPPIGGLDVSPLVAIVGLQIIETGLNTLLLQLMY